MKTGERRIIVNYIVLPEEEEGEGEELAKNTIAYHRLSEAGQLDQSKGSHVLIIDGKLVRYGSELSGEEYEKLVEEHPGAFYGAIVREVVGTRFSSIESGTLKEWQVCAYTISCTIIKVASLETAFAKYQVHMRIRIKAKPNVTATMANIERDKSLKRDFRMVLDTGAPHTIIPPPLRAKLPTRPGWRSQNIDAIGYGSGSFTNKVSQPWEVSLGDGTNWTDWIETKELYSWNTVSDDVTCGLVGFNILNKTYQIKVPDKPYAFVTNNDITDQLQQIYSNGSD